MNTQSPLHRLPLALCGLALGLVLAGCGSSSRSSEPEYAQDIQSRSQARRQADTEALLQKQISPPLDQPLRVLQMAQPRYPSFLISVESPDARGDVTVSFEVMPSGMVGATKVLPGSHEALHKPVVDAIRRWRFSPPVRGGQPARLQLQHTFHMAP